MPLSHEMDSVKQHASKNLRMSQFTITADRLKHAAILLNSVYAAVVLLCRTELSSGGFSGRSLAIQMVVLARILLVLD